MKKLFLFLFMLFLLSFDAFAQKATVADTLILKDGVPYCQIFKLNCVLGTCDYSIRTLDGKEVIYVKFAFYKDPAAKSASNTEGNVYYREWIFLDSGEKAETSPGGEKAIARLIVENDLVAVSSINMENERRFVLINGTPFSEKQSATQGKVIIIKE